MRPGAPPPVDGEEVSANPQAFPLDHVLAARCGANIEAKQPGASAP
jgi:hypothetical protein